MYASYQEVEIPETHEKVGTGWLPSLPDRRDYSEEKVDIPKMVKQLRIARTKRRASLPTKVDLKEWCSSVENQGSLGSCTAHAAAGILEYYEIRAFSRHIDVSRLFTYKTTRNLMGVVGDTGAWLRHTMGSVALCGAPPEKYWPYTTRKQPGPAGERTFDDEPPSFVYAVADNYEALRYFRHDTPGKEPRAVLADIKRWLAAKVPCMFGFYGFPSFSDGDVPGYIPMPCPTEKAVWGHAIAAVGYNDNLRITNTRCNSVKTKGALLIRNSWGVSWGDQGYGWLPYEYVLQRLALDFWSLLRMGWVDTNQFGL